MGKIIYHYFEITVKDDPLKCNQKAKCSTILYDKRKGLECVNGQKIDVIKCDLPSTVGMNV